MLVAAGTAFAVSPIVAALQGLYGVAKEFNAFLDEHIEKMKSSENPTIARTGRILGGAKSGFGIGYVTPVVVISIGQFLLGNTLAAASTIGTAATLSNPIAMTCAAVGAIYYGWTALTDVERDEILAKVSTGLEIGAELIKSIVRFVIDKTKELLSAENLEEIKKFIGSAAGVFGRTLGDVTHKLGDMAADTFDLFKRKSSEVVGKTRDVASEAYRAATETAGNAAVEIADTLSKTRELAADATAAVAETTSGIATSIKDSAQRLTKK